MWYGVLRRWPVLPTSVLIGMVVCAIFAPLIAPHSPSLQTLTDRNAAPYFLDRGWYEKHPRTEIKYILGADFLGRDVLSRVIYGARISLMVSAIAISAGMLVGSSLGLIAGYFGGLVDEVIMRFVDAWLSVPFILLALVIAVVLGASMPVLMGLLAMLAWVVFVRNVRAEVLSLKTRDYVALAQVAGASSRMIIVRHILPNVINTILVLATLRIGQLILAEATLSFLGAGMPAQTAAWGVMIADGRNYVNTAWWTALFPGVAILLVVAAFNFLGDWLRDRFDPRLRQL